MPAVHPCEGIGSKDAGCQAEVVGQAEKIFYTRGGGWILDKKTGFLLLGRDTSRHLKG